MSYLLTYNYIIGGKAVIQSSVATNHSPILWVNNRNNELAEKNESLDAERREYITIIFSTSITSEEYLAWTGPKD